jgi:hypothetical protein
MKTRDCRDTFGELDVRCQMPVTERDTAGLAVCHLDYGGLYRPYLVRLG